MNKKPKIGVVLFPEAIECLKDEPMGQVLMKDGRYFNCETAEQVGNFLNMKIKFQALDKTTVSAEVSIPINFVMYMLSVEDNSKIGFKKIIIFFSP